MFSKSLFSFLFKCVSLNGLSVLDFLYQRNLPDHPDEWFKYNDQNVSKVSRDEVLVDTSGTNANPYLLVYARKGENLVRTVHRTLIQ